MSDDFDIEDVLRASLAEHARQAPQAAPLAERIIAEADHLDWVREPRGPRRWRGWMLPAVAAASVVAVVATIVGLVQLKHSGKHSTDAGAQQSGRRSSSSAPAASGSLFATSASPTETVPTVGKPGGAVPDRFRVVDLTFVGSHAWALGQGDCLDGSSGTCPAVLRSDDDGKDWKSTPTPPVPVGEGCGEAACVTHLRFADANTGYAFGPGALYTTQDGGQSWSDVSQGDTTSLEVANGTALRVTADQLQISPVGKDSWKAATLPTRATVRAPVVRALSRAYVSAADGNTVYASTDNGADWTARPSPCSPAGSLSSMTAAADGSLVVTCTTSASKTPTLMVSGNDGVSFSSVAAPSGDVVGSPVAATDSSTVFCSTPNGLLRTTDGGQDWQPVSGNKTSGVAVFLGFEGPTTGRWVSGDGSTIYTTTDGGDHWSPHTFT